MQILFADLHNNSCIISKDSRDIDRNEFSVEISKSKDKFERVRPEDNEKN